MACALCYLLGLLTGILFLVLEPYNKNRLIRFHAFQSIFLNIAWIAVYIALSIVGFALLPIPFLGADAEDRSASGRRAGILHSVADADVQGL